MRNRHRAFTLVESLLASVILAVALAGITETVATGQLQMTDLARERNAMMLAEDMMERVLALPYSDPDGASTPGPESGEVGFAAFDNMDDYHNFSEAKGTCTNAAGVAYPSAIFGGFSRSVTVVYGTATATGLAHSITGLTVTVTVKDANKRAWTLSRFVAQPN
jgi:prepilin-type N-terminal cleavage/methylation domain-containing protein